MSAAGPAAHAAPQPSWGSHQPWATQHNRSVLFPVLGLVAMAVPGLFVLGIVSTDIGVSAVIVGAFAAMVPVVVIVAAILWVDRWEPEPSRMLLTAFLVGRERRRVRLHREHPVLRAGLRL